MKWHPRGYGGTRRSPEDVKRDGWLERGLLAVAVDDTRLTWPERELLRQLGEKLYGKRRPTPERGGMMRGRKRKPGRRTACGRLARDETEKETLATVIAARRRHYGVSAREARDPRLGTALGRLNYQCRISDEQYQAGLTFGELYQRHHRTMGLPTPSPRSVAGLLINEGIFGGSGAEPSPDDVARLRRRFDDAMAALDACDRVHRLSMGRRPAALIYRLVCVDEDARDWPDEDIGNLRLGLNALAGVFRLKAA